METVLITGFEPFEGEKINPSWEAVQRLDGQVIAGARICARQLPVVFGQSLEVLWAAMEEIQPALILCVAQAGGRSEISIERIGINIDDARIPDNQGNQPVDQPIIPAGPAAYFSTLPIKAMMAALREAGIPAGISQTAGTFACNHVLYGLLHRLSVSGSASRGGLIHIPWLPAQAVHRPGGASMAVETVVSALEIGIRVALETAQDVRLSGGATH